METHEDKYESPQDRSEGKPTESTPGNTPKDNPGISHNGEGEPKISENAVPPDAWENQKKAYNEAWENNKNKGLDVDL